jgi:nicotinamide-nucleotide amidase
VGIVGNLLKNRKQTLSIAESCTGGGLGAKITAIPGSSEYFLGGIIAYDNHIKIQMLDVNPEDLQTHGAVSEAIAEQMALNIQRQCKSDWSISITGLAGPDKAHSDKPVGTVCIGIATPEGTVITQTHHFGPERPRELIQEIGASTALDQLRRQLLTS